MTAHPHAAPATPASVRTLGDLHRAVPWVLTAEHASNALPAPLRAASEDQQTLSSHWGYDLGVAGVVESMVASLPAVAVLAGFSRLVIDANREPEHPDAVRMVADDHALTFNRGLDAAEHRRRVASYHAPYHDTVTAVVAAQRALERDDELRILSVHSFTPVLGSERRSMEAGVLYDQHDALAERFAEALRQQGFVTALNEPYSGKEFLIYAANRHGHAANLRYLELELRQDILATAAQRQDVGTRVARALRTLVPFGDLA